MEKQFTHIICDPDKCVCCGDCEMACSMTKHQVFDPSLARIRTMRVEPVVLLAVGCQACADAPCVLACPRNALTQDAEKGIILVDQEIRQALKIADYVYVLELGRNRIAGRVDEFTDLKKALWD